MDDGPPGAKKRGPRAHVRPAELKAYVIERLQKLGESGKASEVEKLDVASNAFGKKTKEIAGKDLWKEVTDAARKGNLGSSRANKAGSASASEQRPTKRRKKATDAANAAPTKAPTDLGGGAAAWARRCRGSLEDTWPRLERRAQMCLSKPSTLGLRAPLEIGPGVPEMLTDAMAQWLDASLVACCQAAMGEFGDTRSRPQPDASGGEESSGLVITQPHVLRWLQMGAGFLPPPVRWPPGLHARCLREATLFVADASDEKVVEIEDSPTFF